jgi:hypothetical protein
MKKPSIAILALIVATVLLSATTFALLMSSQKISLDGTIAAVNVGVYSDAACTQNATSLSVGFLNPGGTATQTVYIKNTGTLPETLTMASSNWNPATASSVLTLSWNRQNTVLAAGQSIPATLTLVAAANTGSLTTFGCDVTITGVQ